jgi:hypothetical protein
MSKEFRPWKIDEAQLLPPSVQDYVPQDHVSRLIVSQNRRGLVELEPARPLAGWGEFEQRRLRAVVQRDIKKDP